MNKQTAQDWLKKELKVQGYYGIGLYLKIVGSNGYFNINNMSASSGMKYDITQIQEEYKRRLDKDND